MSVDPTPSTSEMAASTFSYAQAAKGQQGSTAQAPETTQPSKAESSTSAAPTEKSIDTQASTAETSQAASTTEVRPSVTEKQDAESMSGADNDSRTGSVQEKRTESKRDEETSRLDRPWRRNDKSTRSSSAATRSVDEQDSRRRKGKKGKNTDKQSSDNANADEPKPEPEAPKIELADAAPPPVNIWQQRREAQAAKTNPEPIANGPSNTASTSPNPTATTAASASASAAPMNGVQSTTKSGDRPERNASRGNRMAAREAKAEVPPPTNDAVSWPTPETAVQEEKKPAEKPAEKAAQDEGASKPRQKKEWQAYDFVPTVTFETQLPQMRSSKPRGGAKGASSTRTPAGAQGEKNTTSLPPKSTEARERVPRETPNGAPANAPTSSASKRASMDVANARNEQRRPTQNHGAEKARDPVVNHQTEQQPREGRSERGRGGFRGRGGHHAANPHGHQQMMGGPYPPNGSMPQRAQGLHSPPPRGGHGQWGAPAPQRGGRGARNGGYNSHRASLPNGGGPRLPHLQTQTGQYDPYQMQGPMTAVPYQQPYWDNSGIIGLIRQQIEYYFSIENLCKDVYLRAHMDSQGFVPLMFVCGFSRMRQMQPNMDHVRMVCAESDVVDFVVAEDDVERLRRRDGWENWVYPMEKRDQGAQNEGPSRIVYKSRAYHYAQFSDAMAPYGVNSPPPYAGQVPFPDPHQSMGGMVNGHAVQTQLSADVPDFSPSQSVGDSSQLTNGHDAVPSVNGVNGDHAQAATQS